VGRPVGSCHIRPGAARGEIRCNLPARPRCRGVISWPVPSAARRARSSSLSSWCSPLAGLGTWAFLRKREPVITVQTEPVARRNLTELVVATGRIQPVTKVVINPEVSGEIVDLPVREGQVVKKGDLLVRIRPDPYVASRNSADATYRSALANIELSRAEREKARIEFARFEKLYADKLVSESDFLSAKTSLDVATARFETTGAPGQPDQSRAGPGRGGSRQNHHRRPHRRHRHQPALGTRRAGGGDRHDGGHRDHDRGRPERDGGAGRRRRDRRGAGVHRPESAAGGGFFPGPEVRRGGHRDRPTRPGRRE
jgi:hypothetical protein